MKNLQRHTRRQPCGVCGGGENLARGREVRCAGFTLDFVVYCTREQFAGRLPLSVDTSPPSYKHRRFGRCDCGTQHQPTHSEGPAGPAAADHIKDLPPDPEKRDLVYSFALERLGLRAEAFRDLERRGLDSNAVERWLFKSIPRKGREQQAFMAQIRSEFPDDLLLTVPGFFDKNRRITCRSAVGPRDGYIIPYVDSLGRVTGFQTRLLQGDKRYLTPFGTRLAHVYHVCGPRTGLLHVVEGGLKSTVASELGGLWCFGVAGQSLMPEHLEAIRELRPERVAVSLDREVNANTARAREGWLRKLWAEEFEVLEAVWEP